MSRNTRFSMIPGVKRGNGSALRVVVVDDSSTIRKLIVDELANDERIVVVGRAANGLLGLDRIRRLQPDVVLLDLEMPELDGFGVLRELRGMPGRPRVLVFSSRITEDRDSARLAMNLGADDLLGKPVQGLSGLRAFVEETLIPRL